MYLSRAAAAVSFFGALLIGTAVAWVAATGGAEAENPVSPGSVNVTYKLAPVPYAEPVQVWADDLEGVWTGTWDRNQVPCIVEIKRVEGNKFYGTLEVDEAKVTFEGTFHAKDRRVFFRETKVVTLGDYGEWSLGTNSGSFSFDGRTLSGTGVDRWGTYNWNVTKE